MTSYHTISLNRSKNKYKETPVYLSVKLPIAQLEERRTVNPQVMSSNLIWETLPFRFVFMFKRVFVAQLVRARDC